MGKNMTDSFKKRQKTWGIIITFAVLILAFIGSYQYYNDPYYVDQVVPDRLLSSVIYSTLKLYAFDPTVGPGKETPFIYDMAIWLAPLCTVYWIFQLVESLFRHQIGALKRHFTGKKQIMVFGYNQKSHMFLQNLIQKEKEKREIILVTGESIDREKRLLLERDNVLVYEMKALEEGNPWTSQEFSRLHLEKADEMVLFYEDATRNFTLLADLLGQISCQADSTWKGLEGKIYCAVWCEDKVMQRIITDYYDQRKGRKPFNLCVFSMPGMAADALFQSHPLYENCILSKPDISLNNIPMPHVLIAGFGAYGQAVFEKTLLTGILSADSQVSGYQRLRITVVDRELSFCQDVIESRYPGIKRICDVEFIEGDARSIHVIKKLARLPKITYAAVCFSDQTISINMVERLNDYLAGETENTSQVPIAVRMKTDDAVIRCRYGEEAKASASLGNVFAFGIDREILSFDHIIKSSQEEYAKDFNFLYQQVSARIHGKQAEAGKQELWNKLDFEEKESCRAQVLNVPYLKALLADFGPLPNMEEVIKNGEGTETFLERLSGFPALETLAALEHQRWCGFCYSCGYLGYHPNPEVKGKELWMKTEGETSIGKVHYCLIEDWEKLKEDEEAKKTIIYDVYSIYVYNGYVSSSN